MPGGIQRLKELEAAGVELSRNRNFDIFSKAENRRALKLRRYLDALSLEIRARHRQRDLVLSATWEPESDADKVCLELTVPSLSLKLTTYLSADELDAIAQHEDVARALESFGISFRLSS